MNNSKINNLNPDILSLEMKNVTKKFPGGVTALDNVNFNLRSGEIHALLGENGAGKSTLMNILYGYYRSDKGVTYLSGKPVHIRSPKDALNLGIGMVHQNFTLVPTLTVAQNIILGNEINKGPFVDYAKSKAMVRELSQRFGLAINPDAKIWQLTSGEKQRVEIIKALYHNVKILALDEPTFLLAPQETEDLFKMLKRSVEKEKMSFIFITHNLTEAISVSDRITVLRKGKFVDTIAASEATEKTLARMMVGKEVIFSVRKEKEQKGEEILRIEKVSAMGDKETQAVKDVSFSLYEREVLGVAGVSGNGQSELAQVIMGLRKATEGHIFALGKEITNLPTDAIILHGIGYIPDDRRGEGTIAKFSITRNLILNIYALLKYAPKGSFHFLKGKSIRWNQVEKFADDIIKEYGIVCSSEKALACHLSGGNLQKCILGRELSRDPKILIAKNPSIGLDVGAIEFVRKKILEQKKNGKGVVLFSEDLDEIFMISDRIAVMHGGRIIGIGPSDQLSREEVGLMMSGAKK